MNNPLLKYDRVWIVFKNDMLLKVFGNEESAKQYLRYKIDEDINSSLRDHSKLSRIFIQEEPVFDKFSLGI